MDPYDCLQCLGPLDLQRFIEHNNQVFLQVYCLKCDQRSFMDLFDILLEPTINIL